MKNLLKILICLSLIYTPFFAFASAAEKWDYEVVPDQNQKLKVTGHKVGTAVNDDTYKVTIDPKTQANKTKMGTVGLNRLLKITGWGTLGTIALSSLLDSVGWVIDPASQSIWRNKKNDTPSYGGCFDDKYIFTAQNKFDSTCPDKTIEDWLKSLSNDSLTYKFAFWQITPSQVLVDKTETRITYTVSSTNTSTNISYENPNQYLHYKLNPNYQEKPADKEVLTPDTLADYVNQTHPDFADPELAPKLAPHVSPQIAPDLWSPANDFEYDNSPTSKEIRTQLDKQSPTSEDPTVVTDPETGNFDLPNFCSWANVVCDFIKDFNKEPDLSERETKVDIELPKDTPIPEKNYFGWSAYCPFSQKSDSITIGEQTTQIGSDLSSWCQMATEIRPFVIIAGSIASLMIVSGVSMRSED